MAYSDNIEGPWTEYKQNPVIEGPSAPDMRWIEDKGKFFMWGHTKNSQTELWTSVDGIGFEYHTTWRGGNLKYVELDQELNPVAARGKRYMLLDPPAEPPLNDRYRGAEFYLEGDTLYLYSSASKSPRIIVLATAKVGDAKPAASIENAKPTASIQTGK